jgi:hypothetical protein
MEKMPRSAFVRRIVAELPFTKKNRAFVDDLLALEELALGRGPTGFVSGMFYAGLQSRWPREYEAIARELDPKRLAKERREEQREARRRQKQEEEEAVEKRRALERSRRMWARCTREAAATPGDDRGRRPSTT